MIKNGKCNRLVIGLLLLNTFWFISVSHADVGNQKLHLSQIVYPGSATSCLSSLLNPVKKGCVNWVPNVFAAPTYEPYRNLIFVGSMENFLHVLDASNKKLVNQIPTDGRVITNVIFSADKDKLFIGTDKGIVYGMDAYSFENKFSFMADSKVNNDLIVIGDKLFFTSVIGTVYCLNNSNGNLEWSIKRPLRKGVLRMFSISNIVTLRASSLQNKNLSLYIPHPNGYVSVINTSGKVIKKIDLNYQQKSFSDISAPMVLLKNKLWVASFSQGLFGIEIDTGRVKDKISIERISSLSTDGVSLFAASDSSLYAISYQGNLLWQNDFFKIRSRPSSIGFPFDKVSLGSRRIFYGSPSKLLLNDRCVIMFTGLGAGSIFDKLSGKLGNIVGNGVGFSPHISWSGNNQILAMTKRGSLMKFDIKQ